MSPSRVTPDSKQDPSDLELGSAVLVDGKVVAWFVDLELAAEWARENHFGNWLIWRAGPPNIIPLTEDEILAITKQSEELSTLFNPVQKIAD